jgi:hypothetical protein
MRLDSCAHIEISYASTAILLIDLASSSFFIMAGFLWGSGRLQSPINRCTCESFHIIQYLRTPLGDPIGSVKSAECQLKNEESSQYPMSITQVSPPKYHPGII